jgi:methylmalonyl-CoA/ethylmalonyl-CoA epimerase
MGSTTSLAPSPVHFDKIGQIAITVSDLGRARKFYQNTLGMRLLFETGNMVFFQCGETRLMIGASNKPASSEGTILYFRLPDIRAAHVHLKEQGVEFVQEPHLVARMPNHDLWIAFLKDPDGTVLGIMSELARTSDQ